MSQMNTNYFTNSGKSLFLLLPVFLVLLTAPGVRAINGISSKSTSEVSSLVMKKKYIMTRGKQFYVILWHLFLQDIYMSRNV